MKKKVEKATHQWLPMEFPVVHMFEYHLKIMMSLNWDCMTAMNFIHLWQHEHTSLLLFLSWDSNPSKLVCFATKPPPHLMKFIDTSQAPDKVTFCDLVATQTCFINLWMEVPCPYQLHTIQKVLDGFVISYQIVYECRVVTTNLLRDGWSLQS